MKEMFDTILLHPPAIYDFRKRVIMPGPLTDVKRIQYNKVALGVLSIADYLDRSGYKVVVDNLADRMVQDDGFDVERHIKNMEAKVYAVGLHWHHHSQGALEIARLCKDLHPDSKVIMGGLTATCFQAELINKYPFVDAVIKGESEKPFKSFLETLESGGSWENVPNLTYRKTDGNIQSNALMCPDETLDDYEFTRFDLLEPDSSVFGNIPRASLVVCRGCTHNCVTCGASAYSYKRYLGRSKPAFRSPRKIVDDIRKLNAQGIYQVGLYQDPRMGGEDYWMELFDELKEATDLKIERLSVDLLAAADEEFIRAVAMTGIETILYFCPDTGCEMVRKRQGRGYTNADILNTIKLCHRYHLAVTVFFSSGLSGETLDNINDTWELWQQINALDKAAIGKGCMGNISCRVLADGPIMGPIIIEPGSLSYDYPDKYGYKVIYKTLEDYIEALNQPSWHQWINYETDQLDRHGLTELTHEAGEQFIRMRINNGAYNPAKPNVDYILTLSDRVGTAEVDKIMQIDDEIERNDRLLYIKEALDAPININSKIDDKYGYKKEIKEYLLKRIKYGNQQRR